MSKTFIDRELAEIMNRPGFHDRVLASQPALRVKKTSFDPRKGNPFAQGAAFNLTEQLRLRREDPKLFDRLKAEAQRTA